MTIKECIDIVDNIKPNQYTVKEKVGWLSFIDEIIINDVLKTHEGYDGRYDDFMGYSEDKLSAKLIVPSPYDRLYTAYLKMKIDGENGEMARYNNSAELFNSYMMEYRKHYNKTHMPLDVTKKDSRPKPGKGAVTLPDSVIENIKRDLYAMLSEDVAEQTSEDKIYSIVTSYMQTNAAMLKGRDGKTPEKGVDYVDGKDGVGIKDIRVVERLDDGGENLVRIFMTDGGMYVFQVRNGSKGDKPVVGVDYFTHEDREAIKSEVLEEVADEITNQISDKEDKSNKVGSIDITNPPDVNTEEYPTTYAVADAIIRNGVAVEQNAIYTAESYTDHRVGQLNEKTTIIKSDVEGLKTRINNEAHFRGYLSTNAKIKALEATPNDFAYSAESGTKWVYDAREGWQDTGAPVPDQLTPASETVPLINGTASVGSESAYARGDHRHPTDTTRASAAEVNTLKANKVTTISEESTDEQYPSAKATFDTIQNKVGWELVKIKKSDGTIAEAKYTLTSDATLITNTFEHQYKELYVLMEIATMKSEEVTEVPLGRVAVYAGKRYNNQIFEESNVIYSDSGVPFTLTFHIELCGKYFRVHRYYKSNTESTFYAGTAITSSGYADIGKTYMDMLTLEFKPTARKFPVGTKFELWGIRA